MGSQGTICAVYGIVVPASVKDTPCGEEEPPVLYEVNGFTVAGEGDADDLPDYGVSEPDIVACIRSHGPTLTPPLSIRILGHSDEMGARHFNGKALVGYCVGGVYDIDQSSELPPLHKIESYGTNLVLDIKEQLGLEIEEDALRLHLMFDGLNGF